MAGQAYHIILGGLTNKNGYFKKIIEKIKVNLKIFILRIFIDEEIKLAFQLWQLEKMDEV